MYYQKYEYLCLKNLMKFAGKILNENEKLNEINIIVSI